MIWRSLIILAVLLCSGGLSAHDAAAYPKSYPPFPSGTPAPYPSWPAQPVIDGSAPATVVDGDLRIVATPSDGEQSSTVTIFLGGVQVFDVRQGYEEVFFAFGSRVFYADLTGDGARDVLIYTYPGGNGLGAEMELADLLIRRPDGNFSHQQFVAFAGGPEDFLDVNGDGRYEMLWVNYYFEGGHSYWVYRVVEISDDGLRLNDHLLPDFPKIIWFTEKPNDKPTQRLTTVEREDLIRQSTAGWQGADQ